MALDRWTTSSALLACRRLSGNVVPPFTGWDWTTYVMSRWTITAGRSTSTSGHPGLSANPVRALHRTGRRRCAGQPSLQGYGHVSVPRCVHVRGDYFPGHRLDRESCLLCPQAPRRTLPHDRRPSLQILRDGAFLRPRGHERRRLVLRFRSGTYIKAERSYCGDLISLIKGWNTFFSQSNTTDPALPVRGDGR